MWDQDWKQFRKNLEVEREAWAKYIERRELVRALAAERIETKRREIEQKKQQLEAEFQKFRAKQEAECHRKQKWAYQLYLREIKKKSKPSVSF